MEEGLKKVGRERCMSLCPSLVPDRVVPWASCKPAGLLQQAECVAQVCRERMRKVSGPIAAKTLHVGCSANDAPGDRSSLAPV